MAAIVGSEIQTRLSTKSGAAGNTTAGSANSSLGKYAATTVWAGGSLHDLFDQISGSENQAGSVEYRCIFVHNTNGNNPAQNVRVSLLSEVAGGATLSIGVDPTAASPVGSAAAQALSVANETTAPAGVSFSSPTTYAAGVDLGTIPVGHVRALWIRRAASNTAAVSNDGGVLQFDIDTGSL